ncbi:sulfotransferase family protein [Microbulbifer aggregans]|uniref:sulfotransferase family protein n=1 Tax=Microbulbifer aggregans TaxID=1769779 RepID=UPI001CFEA4F1|nr:sulfotransferase [Microbulbifer aggregans]
MSRLSETDIAQQNEALKSPVFVIGPLRSGSTLLRLLMNHHPNIYMFGEFEGAVSQAQGNSWPNIHDYWRFVKTDRQTSAMNLSIDETLDYPQLVKSFLAQHYARNPQSVIGASVHSRVDLLLKLWPDARFIHLYRDPRDVARSCIGMGWVGNVYEGTKIWVQFEQRRKKLREQERPGQSITVSYEVLVSNPDSELARVCEFLSLPYDEEMLEIEGGTTYQKPSSKYANQWKSKLSAREIRWVEIPAKDLMMQQGYKPVIDHHPKISIIEILAIRLQNRCFRATYNIKKWGVMLWVEHVFAKRSGIARWIDHVKIRTNQIDRALLK